MTKGWWVLSVLVSCACSHPQDHQIPETGAGQVRYPTQVISYAAQQPGHGCGAWEREITTALCTVLGEARGRQFRSENASLVVSVTLVRLPGHSRVGIPKSVAVVRAALLTATQQRLLEQAVLRQISQQGYELALTSDPVIPTVSVTVLYTSNRYKDCPLCRHTRTDQP